MHLDSIDKDEIIFNYKLLRDFVDCCLFQKVRFAQDRDYHKDQIMTLVILERLTKDYAERNKKAQKEAKKPDFSPIPQNIASKWFE